LGRKGYGGQVMVVVPVLILILFLIKAGNYKTEMNGTMLSQN